MTKADQPQAVAHGAAELKLVNSNRLQALRKQSSSVKEESPKPSSTTADAQETPEETQLRLLVNQHLNQVLAQLPNGKQHSLFKIRFGIAVDELKSLPPKQIAKILKMHLPKH